MLFNITLAVLASVVPIVVVLGLLIYVQNVQSRLEAKLFANYSAMQGTLTTWSERLNERVNQCLDRVAACESGLQQTSGTHLHTELAALAGDVAALAKTVKKNFGRVWAELHHDGLLDRNERSQSDVETPPAETAEETRARLRREHRLPRVGGAPSGANGGE